MVKLRKSRGRKTKVVRKVRQSGKLSKSGKVRKNNKTRKVKRKNKRKLMKKLRKGGYNTVIEGTSVEQKKNSDDEAEEGF